MRHLIPYLQDDRKATDYLRQLRWPDSAKCPRCGSQSVEPRERCDNGLQRFNCLSCAARRTDSLEKRPMLPGWQNRAADSYQGLVG